MKILRFSLLLLLTLLILTAKCSDDDQDNQEGSGDENPQNSDQNSSDSGNITSKEIKIGEKTVVDFKQAKETGQEQLAALFHFNIDEKIEDQDLIILVLGRQDFSHSPALYISKETEVPGFEDYKVKQKSILCGIEGIDICELPHNELEVNQTYHIGVYCLANCKFEVKLKYEQHHNIEIGEHISIQYSQTEAKEIKVHIPKDIVYNNLIVEANLMNPGSINTPFKLYAFKNEKQESSINADFVAEDIWFNGKGFKISKGDTNWETGIDIILIIEAEENALIYVQVKGYDERRDIYLNKESKDIVKSGKIVAFNLEIPKNSILVSKLYDLSIDVETYVGDVEVYIKFADKEYDSPKDYPYKILDVKGYGSVTIDSDAMIQNAKNGIPLVIEVFGISSSTFEILPYISGLSNRALVFDCLEQGYLSKQHMEQYQLGLNEKEDVEVTLTLETLQGNADLYLKICKQEPNPTQCSITSEDIAQKEILNQKNVFKYSEKDGYKIDQIKFTFKTGDCNSMSFAQDKNCQFTVGVLGQSNLVTHYKLSARHPNSHIQLMENEQIHQQIILDDSLFFKFQVLDDRDIDKIIFHVTSISGEIAVYMSRKEENQYPDYAHSEVQGFYEVEGLLFSSKNGPLKGNYYMTIKGLSEAYFNILVKVYRKKSNGEIQAAKQQLHYGQPLRSYVYYKQTETFWFYPDRKYDTRKKTRLFLYYNQYQQDTKQIMGVYGLSPRIVLTFIDKATKTKKQINIIETYRNYQFVYIEFPTEQEDLGHYEIQLIHDFGVFSDVMFEVNISINAQDVWRIIPDYGYINSLDEERMSANYEMYIASPQQVYVELFDCFGNTKLDAATSYEKLESEKYDEPLKAPSYKGNHKIIPFSIEEKGGFYFRVTAKQLDSKIGKKSLFMILPHSLPLKSEMPHNTFYIPHEKPYDAENELMVKYLDYDSKAAAITMKRIRCVNDCIGYPYEIDNYLYILHIVNDQELLPFFSKCDLSQEQLYGLGVENTQNLKHYTERQEIRKDDEQSTLIQFNMYDLPDEKLYVQAMGVVFIKTSDKFKPQPYTFIYQPTEIDFSQVKKPDTNTGNNTTNGNQNNNNQNQQPQNNTDTVPRDYQVNTKQDEKEKKGGTGLVTVFFWILVVGIIGFLLFAVFFYKRRQREGMGLLPDSVERSDQ